jgi:osmotically-inducible protein OsmY
MAIAIEKTDTDLKMDVLAQLKFEPSIKITEIGVLVKDGVVTLIGHASSYGEKLDAVSAAKRVAGVVAIADEIDITLPEFAMHSDSDIASAAANRIQWCTQVHPGTVHVTVRGGTIALEGTVEWAYQKHAAEAAVHNLAGVKAISNQIAILPTQTAEEIGTDLRAAIDRNALLDQCHLQVETSGSKVVLKGRVHHHAELEEVVRLAWAAPGVHTVENHVKVEWLWGIGG